MEFVQSINLTTTAIDEAYEANAQAPRLHLGASVIGDECLRKLWYGFRWVVPVKFSGRILRLFETGKHEEQRMIADLRRAGVEVWDKDENGEQWSFSDFGGHFSGSMDAVVKGLKEAPKTAHVFEAKTSNAKGFAKMLKDGVLKTKPEHHCQMVVYMDKFKLTRAYYLVKNKDTDEYYSERLTEDKALAKTLREIAWKVITAPRPLRKLSEDPAHYKCKFCNFYDHCHAMQEPERNCRTCLHSTPDTDRGGWTCELSRFEIDYREHRCPAHLFIPDLLSNLHGAQVDAGDGWVKYADGFTDGAK
jgi:hypothetical protein